MLIRLSFALTNYVKEEEREGEDEPVGPHVPARNESDDQGDKGQENQDLLTSSLCYHCFIEIYCI